MGIAVETRQGRVEGFEADGLAQFRGIPFAQPPVGALRFAAPAPPESWAGVRDARAFSLSAPQLPVDFDLIPGLDVGPIGEDCLYLNVVTPAADGARRPVLVWIHGGAFTIGSASQDMYDPRPLARRGDVVVVSINYRLGAFGFLSLEPHLPDATANAGLLDQVAALRWVRDNVEAFGGDPANVTIFGESAGGMSVGCLLGLPAAAGLFTRAVPMSGAAHSMLSAEVADEVVKALLDELSLGSAPALRDVPVDALLRAQAVVEARLRDGRARGGFRPAVDGNTLPEPPIDAIRGGLSRDVDVLTGAARDEWKLFGFMDPGAAKLDDAGLERRIEERVPGAGARIIDAYRKARPEATPPELFFAIETDRIFSVPSILLAEAQSGQRARTYSYLFTWESPLLDGALGACHGIDVPFVFGAIGTAQAERFAGSGPDAQRLCERAMDAWLGFARTGDPGHPDLPAWPGYEPGRRATMLFGAACELANDPLGAERRAWEGVDLV